MRLEVSVVRFFTYRDTGARHWAGAQNGHATYQPHTVGFLSGGIERHSLWIRNGQFSRRALYFS